MRVKKSSPISNDCHGGRDTEAAFDRSGRAGSSCAECQRLKLRCDRKGPPCGSCVHRGCESICPEGTLISTGRGKRSVMSHVQKLNTVITEMGERVRQLQDALVAVGVPPQKQKLYITTDTRHLSDSTPAQKGEAFGSMSVNGDGNSLYFGPTAGCAAVFASKHNSEGSSSRGERFFFTAITESFSSDQTSRWDVDLALDQLCAHLPLEQRAWNLCDTYYRNGCWTGMPVMQAQTVELLSLIYHNIGTEDGRQPTATATAQQMTVLYLIFALAALVDLDLPPYSPEADQYFDLACAAMSVKSLFEDPQVETVQALTLFACYYGHGGPRFSMDGAWVMISLASQISQRLGLYRESFGVKLPGRLLNRCRILFWETYFIETIYGLSLGRPTGTLLSNVSCPFPPDELDDAHPFVKLFPGYLHTRWGYTKNIAAPIMEDFTAISKPSYKAVLEMDRTIRKYMHLCPCERFPSLEDEPPSAYAQRHLLPLLSKFHIMYIHSGSLVEAIQDKPANPFASAYAHSVAAAYIAASSVVEANKRNFATHPSLFTRWRPIRESLFNAALILGTFASRYPTPKPLHPYTILNLFTAVDLIEKITESGGRMGGGLTIIRRLLDKAIAMHSQGKSPDTPTPLLSVAPEIGRELEILAGQTSVVEHEPQTAIDNSSAPTPRRTEPEFWLRDLNSLVSQPLDATISSGSTAIHLDLWDTVQLDGAQIPHLSSGTDFQDWADFLPGL
ncbi:hypothetical protein B0H14DRAFT_3868188 [Mycena olivaceomarginata]|nr:hypothetical protein B0H14DRAFT_3868188 [Mycena olivaceomarginata]